jgi:16S rRNA (cytosine967-C5)-methyltransferase
MTGPARRVAYDLLRAVDERGAYANLTMAHLLRQRHLDTRDAALATELGYGTVRRQGSLDAVLELCTDRPIGKVDPPLRDALRLGAYQLLHTRIPAHAAVSQTVDLARSVAGPGAARYANAVLRKVAECDWTSWREQLTRGKSRTEALAVEHGYPAWIVNAFADALGPRRSDELEQALDEKPPLTHLAARPGRISRDELLEQAGPAAAASRYSPYGVVLEAGDPARIAAVRDHRASVQDEGSQLVTVAFTRVPVPGSERRWLDLAAGPGGKAALLDGLAAERGSVLLANELAHHRARLVGRTLGGGLVVQADGNRPPWRPASFDRVLLDAPCSGLGALRRRPDARWRRGPADVARLTGLQRDLLTVAIRSTRPGGVVAYATCSPHVAETRAVVDAVKRKMPNDVAELDARSFLEEVPDLGAGPHVQLWPHRHGTDAMFLALLRVNGGRS